MGGYRRYVLLFVLLGVSVGMIGQTDTLRERISKPVVYVATGGVLASSFILLDKAWYNQFERAPFHFFDDGREWLGMDKAGHIFSSYTIGRFSHDLFRWAGLDERSGVWLGAAGGFLYTASIEILDGTSAEWGFSVWDMAANTFGTGLFVAQQLAWGEQCFLPKYSAHRTDLASIRPELLGRGLAEELFKDYNGQTYWLSYSPFVRHVVRNTALKSGLFCVSLGYGANNMVGALDNTLDNELVVPERFSSFYLSIDLDLKKIKTRSKFLKTVFNVLNGIKVPAPTLEVTSQGTIHGHWIYF